MSNYRIAYDKGFQDLSERSPHEIAVFLHVRYDSTAESFLVPYFGEDYKVDCKAKTVTKCSDGNDGWKRDHSRKCRHSDYGNQRNECGPCR